MDKGYIDRVVVALVILFVAVVVGMFLDSSAQFDCEKMYKEELDEMNFSLEKKMEFINQVEATGGFGDSEEWCSALDSLKRFRKNKTKEMIK